MWDSLERRTSAMRTGASRRELLRQTGILTLAGALPAAGQPARNVTASTDKAGAIYRSIGVSPLINARGTFTIITGSQSLPEVKKAMEEASHSYVQMDELMGGVSKCLAELTGADWGIVTAGCCAALTPLHRRLRLPERTRSACSACPTSPGLKMK